MMMREWVAESSYTKSCHRKDDNCGLSARTHRVNVKCQRVEVSEEKEMLFEEYRH